MRLCLCSIVLCDMLAVLEDMVLHKVSTRMQVGSAVDTILCDTAMLLWQHLHFQMLCLELSHRPACSLCFSRAFIKS